MTFTMCGAKFTVPNHTTALICTLPNIHPGPHRSGPWVDYTPQDD